MFNSAVFDLTLWQQNIATYCLFLLCAALLFPFTLAYADTPSPLLIEIAATPLDFSKVPSVAIEIDHATTPEQINWGLMQRRSLANNAGLFFHLEGLKTRTFWSFNCWIDLSVAFLDQDSTVQEIFFLPAHPTVMQQIEPIENFAKLQQHKISREIYYFFLKHAVTSRKPAKFALEMNAFWFEKNGVTTGAQLHWNTEQNAAYFIKALDLTFWQAASYPPLLVLLPNVEPLPHLKISPQNRLVVVELDETQKVQDIQHISGDFSLIILSRKAYQCLLVSDSWMKEHSPLQVGNQLHINNISMKE